MGYMPYKPVPDMSNPSDTNSFITIQGLINALALYSSVANTYTKTQVDALVNPKQDALGYTAENQANKSTSTSLGTSNTLYPTQNAVKVYTDTVVKGTFQVLTANTTLSPGVRYYVNPATNITLILTLPTSFAQDDLFVIFGKTGTFKIVQNAGQTIRSVQGSTTTGSGGSLTSTNQYATLTLRGLTPNTDILVTTQQGTFQII
jgi:hypothetical protein